MFLITTADQRFWKTDEPVLFLGEWCKLYKERATWSRLEHQVVPYHWDDRQQFGRDWEYLDAVYERYLVLMADCLNRIHDTRYSVRYWRIVIGMWLRAFIDALFDRYASIAAAAKSGLVTNTWICSTEPWTPESLPSFSFDDYNLYLYSRIIKHLRPFPYEERPLRHLAALVARKRPKSSLARFGSEVVRQASKGFETVVRQGLAVLAVEVYPRLIRRLPAKVVFVGTTYLTLPDQVRLQIALGQIPFLYHGEKILFDPSTADRTTRGRFVFPDSADPFERILNELLPDQLPMIYVEDYRALHDKAMAISPPPPPVAFTVFSMHYRQCFEFWAGYSTETRGTKILLSQHGGGFGTARHSSVEAHFVRISDRYYSWGSPHDDDPKVKPMPSFRLRSSAKELHSSDPAGPLLWLATSTARYKTFAESGVVGPHMLRYIDEQERFLRSLCGEAQDLLLWRYFNDLWEERDRFQEKFPRLRMQHGAKNQLGKKTDFFRESRKCRLAIHTANETTYLQSLAANFPSLMYWNPELYEIRPSLQPHFDRLQAVGVMHYTPESAAATVNAIYRDTHTWWNSAALQEARQNFCFHLARTSDDWLSQWVTELNTWQPADRVRRMHSL